jgi:hypothetical protein
VSDLRWDDISWFFDAELMGTLPDVCEGGDGTHPALGYDVEAGRVVEMS